VKLRETPYIYYAIALPSKTHTTPFSCRPSPAAVKDFIEPDMWPHLNLVDYAAWALFSNELTADENLRRWMNRRER